MKKAKCSYCGNTQDYSLKFCTICDKEMPEKAYNGKGKNKKSDDLLDEKKTEHELHSILCKNCGNEGPPQKWSARTAIGVIYLLLAGIIPGLIIFISSNPYICPKCDKRDYLIKKYNNGTKEAIKCKTTGEFLAISIILLLTIIFIVIYNISSYQSGPNSDSNVKFINDYNSGYSSIEEDMAKLENSLTIDEDGNIKYEKQSDIETDFGKFLETSGAIKSQINEDISSKIKKIDFDANLIDDPYNATNVNFLDKTLLKLRLMKDVQKETLQKEKAYMKVFLIKGAEAMKSDLPYTYKEEMEYFQDLFEDELVWLESMIKVSIASMNSCEKYIKFLKDNNASITVVDGSLMYETKELYQEGQNLYDEWGKAEAKSKFYLENYRNYSKSHNLF